MAVFDTIRQLRSFRTAKDELIPRKTMGEILEAGRHAPSPGNVQSMEFIVVEDEDKKRVLADATGDERFRHAPTSVIVLSDDERMSRKVGQGFTDEACNSEAACAVQNMRLTAREEGISSCWVTGFDRTRISNTFAIPTSKTPRAVAAFCYAEDEYDNPDRFGIKEVVFYNEYDKQIRNLFDNLEWKGLRENRKTARRTSKRRRKGVRERLEKYL